MRERAANFALFALLPSVLYWSWYLGPGNDNIPADYQALEIAAPLSGILITFAPLVFQQGEFIYEKMLGAIAADDEAAGWDIAAIQRAIDRVDGVYHRLTLPLAALVGGSVGYVMYQIRDIAPIGAPAGLAGEAVVLACLGHVTATGIWGAGKVLLVLRATAASANPHWKPFRTPTPGFQYLFRFAWINGVNFSLGNCTVPALVVVWPRLNRTSQTISAAFIVLTAVGGLLLFCLTTWWLNSLSQRMRNDAVAELTPHIETLSQNLARLDQLSASEVLRTRHGLDAVLTLRRQLLAEYPAPQVRTVFRASTTVLLPVALLLLQLLVQHMLE
jgi:hypothetical protein